MARILVIDDDSQFREMLCMALEDAGYEVEEACDGEEGLRRYEARPADLIITDIIMPNKEGLEMILDLQRDNGQARIIAVSGGSRQLDGAMALECARAFGAMHVFSKPFEIETLLATVREVLAVPLEGSV